jgi:cytochrome c biogenesis protein
VIVRDARGRVVFDDSVVFLPQDGNFTSAGVVKAPDARPQLGLRGLFLPTATVDPERGPVSLFPAPDDPALFLSAYTGDLGLDEGTPQSVYELETGEMRQLGLRGMREGETWRLPDGAGSIEFAGYDRWVSLKVARDPGGSWALVFVGVAIVGLCLSLFVKRRRIWVVAGPSEALVAGAGRGDAAPTEQDVADVAGALVLAGAAEERQPVGADDDEDEEEVSRA